MKEAPKSDDNDAMYEKMYHTLNKKLEQLRDLRIQSVKYDIEDITKKIEEHKSVHEVAVSELVTQNQKLRDVIEQRRAFRDSMSRMRAEMLDMRRFLARREPLFGPFIERNLGYTIEILGHRLYKISYGNIVSMKMHREHEDVLCEFLSYDPRLPKSKAVYFLPNHRITFPLAQLENFVTALNAGIRHCEQ